MTTHTDSHVHGYTVISTIIAWGVAVLFLIGGSGLPLAVQATAEYECRDNEVCRNIATLLPLHYLGPFPSRIGFILNRSSD